jgi:hypothetical protein
MSIVFVNTFHKGKHSLRGNTKKSGVALKLKICLEQVCKITLLVYIYIFAKIVKFGCDMLDGRTYPGCRRFYLQLFHRE